MIVLTGGAGFIGSCFLKRLNEIDIKDVIVVDHLGREEKWKNLVGKRFLKFYNVEEFIGLVQSDKLQCRFDTIVHLGACTTTTEKDADYVIENNLNYSIELAEYAIKKNIRFIYASSAATYGNGDYGYSDHEYEKLKPLNVYGLSKHLFDLWVLDKNLDKKFTGLKFFNVFGPNEYHKNDMASMIYKAYHQIVATGSVKLYKSTMDKYIDGGQMRDFVYVKDVVEVMLKVFEKKNFSGIYNLGSGTAHTWNELMEAVFHAMGKPVSIEYIDMPERLTKQYQYYTQADMSKLSKTECRINFRSLGESVEDYVRNYLMNDWKYY